MRYIKTKPLSQKNQKNFDMFFRRALICKFDHIPHQTNPNQIKPSGLLQKLQNHVILEFLEKWAPGSPKTEKINFWGFFAHCGPQKSIFGVCSLWTPKINFWGFLLIVDPKKSPKNFSNFRDRTSKRRHFWFKL